MRHTYLENTDWGFLEEENLPTWALKNLACRIIINYEGGTAFGAKDEADSHLELASQPYWIYLTLGYNLP